jgi:N-acetylneuraminate synthase
VKTAWTALGQVDYGRKSSEIGNVKFRRSLYFVKDMKAGDVITPHAVKSIRPGFGIAPKHLETIMQRTLKADVSRGTPVSFDLLVS